MQESRAAKQHTPIDIQYNIISLLLVFENNRRCPHRCHASTVYTENELPNEPEQIQLQDQQNGAKRSLRQYYQHSH